MNPSWFKFKPMFERMKHGNDCETNTTAWDDYGANPALLRNPNSHQSSASKRFNSLDSIFIETVRL